MRNLNRLNVRLLIAIVALVAVKQSGAAQKTETLGSVKQTYLNQRVVLIGFVSNELAKQPVLMNWNPVIDRSAGRYTADIAAYLPATYKGKAATVIAIQLNKPEVEGRVNALGERLSADDAVDPYFDFIVRFDDGKMAMATGYASTITEEARLASTENGIAQEMAAKLPGVVGKTFYGCFYTKLYSADATLDELLGAYAGIKAIDFPFLVPLKITGVKFDEAAGAVVLKVALPDGKVALTIASGDELAEKAKSFMERISGSMLSEIPKKFTPREIAAIRKETLFRGMSRDAAYCSQGFPHSINNWGSSGKQLVYADGLMIYLNNQNSVVDWQLLGSN